MKKKIKMSTERRRAKIIKYKNQNILFSELMVILWNGVLENVQNKTELYISFALNF